MKSNSEDQDRSLFLADTYGASVRVNASMHGMSLEDAAARLLARYKVELERGDGSRSLEFLRSRVEALQKLVDSFAGK